MIKRPGPLDLAQFEQDYQAKKTMYGLPYDVTYCTKCVFSNQKPNSEQEYKHNVETKKPTLKVDTEGVCSACKVVYKKDEINWQEREEKLIQLCDKYRGKGQPYDCLVPGSGGKDSVYASHILKYKYGMNPLTVTWAPHIYTDWGWKNFQSWMDYGHDNYLFTPNNRARRLLTRLSVEHILHPFQPFIVGQMYFPIKLAAKLGIELIFYGENPVEYGNEAKENDSAKKDPKYFSASKDTDFYLGGVSVEDLKSKYGMTDQDLEPYLPADPNLIQDNNIDVQYLGYYLKWHPQSCYYYAVENGGFKASPERTVGTYSKYSSIDDKIDDLHYFTTWIKFGIGRASYDSSQEVRSKDILRDEAVALVHKFDGEYPERFLDECLEYLSLTEKEHPVAYKQFESPKMDREYFDNLCDKFRSPHLWTKDSGQWKLRKIVENINS